MCSRPLRRVHPSTVEGEMVEALARHRTDLHGWATSRVPASLRTGRKAPGASWFAGKREWDQGDHRITHEEPSRGSPRYLEDWQSH
jgi:hypothetical protein